jgi:hypothetical protein
MFNRKPDQFDDLADYAIPTTKLDAASMIGRKQNPRKKGVFLPQDWLEKLQSARHTSTWRLACFLVGRHWLRPGEPVTLSNVVLASCDLSPDQKCRALQELENLGLIRVERRSKRAPTATITL